MSVLVAHRHLGEKTSIMSRSIAPQIQKLSDKGWVEIVSRAEQGIEVAMSEEAVAELMTFEYTPALAVENPPFQPLFRETIKKAWKLQVKLARER